MGSHSSVDSQERSGIDSGSRTVDSHEKSETNNESSSGKKSNADRRLSKKLTGDND